MELKLELELADADANADADADVNADNEACNGTVAAAPPTEFQTVVVQECNESGETH